MAVGGSFHDLAYGVVTDLEGPRFKDLLSPCYPDQYQRAQILKELGIEAFMDSGRGRNLGGKSPPW